MKTFKKLSLHTVAIVMCGGFLSSTVSAGQNQVQGVTVDHYKTVVNQRPYRVEVCSDVAVSGDRTRDTVTGAIIGGIIGHQIGNGDERKDNRNIGAVIGGMIGHDNSDAVGGYRTQCRIETRYEEETVEVYSHSTISFIDNGRKYILQFQRR